MTLVAGENGPRWPQSLWDEDRATAAHAAAVVAAEHETGAAPLLQCMRLTCIDRLVHLLAHLLSTFRLDTTRLCSGRSLTVLPPDLTCGTVKCNSVHTVMALMSVQPCSDRRGQAVSIVCGAKLDMKMEQMTYTCELC